MHDSGAQRSIDGGTISGPADPKKAGYMAEPTG